MSDTLITIIAIFLAAILMFVFPLMAVANQNDEIAQVSVQSLVSEFVNNASTKGKITRSDYDAFKQKLYATGNSYDIEIEIQVLDENPGKKGTATSQDLIGENVYYSIFTTTVIAGIDSTEAEYLLKKGDNIIVTVKNTNVTIATQIKNFMYRVVGKDTYTIGASASALVVNTGK